MDDCEAVAMRALGFVASRQSELDRLLSHTGRSPADLERQPIDPDLLMASLDVLITNEKALLEFSRTVGLPPEAAYEARRLCRHVLARTKGKRQMPKTAKRNDWIRESRT